MEILYHALTITNSFLIISFSFACILCVSGRSSDTDCPKSCGISIWASGIPSPDIFDPITEYNNKKISSSAK
ncbi:hypothetical protein AYI69_g5752 [Smittium culicis]|uniref:Uncharacterized protein n=1 Tax=Smittium culicis TaxID=133412 RepID=A0A1R1Y426_9FUNG|nr:hypothetical protein AYI69_g5752 [Smittium culicis]